MIAFKKMWEDVSGILLNDKIGDVVILERYSTGFVIKDKDDTEFLTKDDFVDLWGQMLCYNEISLKQFSGHNKSKLKYAYEVLKNLPYISEKSGCLKLIN
jgi:hypothetical protein